MQTLPEVKEIIVKWYKELQFPSKYDEEFYEALDKIYVDANSDYASYYANLDLNEEDGKKNFLYWLYFCEDLKKRYLEKGIPLKYLYDILEDMPVWLDIWSELKGGLFFGELGWFQPIFRMAIFKIGRLQFHITGSYMEVPEIGLHKGDNVLNLHIPARGPLYPEDCLASIKAAPAFFKAYFPEYSYEHMICYSWLLGKNLDDMLKPGSNILQFKDMFNIHKQKESDAIINYVVGWKRNREDAKNMTAVSGLQKELKTRVLAGETFYAGSGTIKKDLLEGR